MSQNDTGAHPGGGGTAVRSVAAGGWRRALAGLAVGLAVGAAIAAALPRTPVPPDRQP